MGVRAAGGSWIALPSGGAGEKGTDGSCDLCAEVPCCRWEPMLEPREAQHCAGRSPGMGALTAAVGADLFLSTHFFLLGTGMDEITAGLPLPRENKTTEGCEGTAL